MLFKFSQSNIYRTDKLIKKMDKRVNDFLFRGSNYVQRSIKSTIGSGTNKPRTAGRPMSFRKDSYFYVDLESGDFKPRRWVEVEIPKILKAKYKKQFRGRAPILKASIQKFISDHFKLVKANGKRGVVKKLIAFEVQKEKKIALVGVPEVGGSINEIAKAHEFGKMFRGRKYEKRSFVQAGGNKAVKAPGFQNIVKQTLGKL